MRYLGVASRLSVIVGLSASVCVCRGATRAPLAHSDNNWHLLFPRALTYAIHMS